MKRRDWFRLAGGAGLLALGAGCGATGESESARINLPAADRLGGDGYGIWHGNRLVGGRNLGLRQESFSITKSLAALAVVRATGEGWLEPDQPLGEVIPEWRADPRKCRVTVRMLVNQTAGFPSGEAALYRGRLTAHRRSTGRMLPLRSGLVRDSRRGAAAQSRETRLVHRGSPAPNHAPDRDLQPGLAQGRGGQILPFHRCPIQRGGPRAARPDRRAEWMARES